MFDNTIGVPSVLIIAEPLRITVCPRRIGRFSASLRLWSRPRRLDDPTIEQSPAGKSVIHIFVNEVCQSVVRCGRQTDVLI